MKNVNKNEISNKNPSNLTEKVLIWTDPVFFTGFFMLTVSTISGWGVLPLFVKNAFVGIWVAYLAAFKIRKDRFDYKNIEHLFMFLIFIISSFLAGISVLQLNESLSKWCVLITQGLIIVPIIYSLIAWILTKRKVLDKWDILISILAIIQTLNLIH